MSDRKTASIPDVQGVDPAIGKILKPMRELLHKITGRMPKQGPIAALPVTATLSDVINKVNEIIERLNA